MPNSKTITAYEYCKLYCGGSKQSFQEVSLPEKTFELLWNYVDQTQNDDLDQIMSLNKKGRHYISLSKYVGTIQTSDGTTIEVLPKIYKASSGNYADAKTCKDIFLEMLRHFQDSNAKSFQHAPLNSSKDFPLLEVYIFNYLDEVDNLLAMGLKKNYSQVDENSNFLKGKLLVSQNIQRNQVDQSHFYIRHSKYVEDIPQNRILVSTLNRLLDLTGDLTNEGHIYSLLARIGDIPPSTNIDGDLRVSLSGNRLFSSYDQLMVWSEKILHGEGFTSFAGSTVNLSLFFKAESLFESYIAHLFQQYVKKFPMGLKVYPQHDKYTLVDKHGDGKTGIFKMKPDIVIEAEDHSEIYILDTKWKVLDAGNKKGNYGISQDDMYQLYAYGNKYKHKYGEKMPKLSLIYPATDKFNKDKPISNFVYDDGSEVMKLEVIPFDLSDKTTYDEQIQSILHKFYLEFHFDE